MSSLFITIFTYVNETILETLLEAAKEVVNDNDYPFSGT